jgi:hypothetical protein
VILAHGVKLDQIANLVFRGLAKREVSNVTVGGRQVKVVRMQITAAGRKPIADWTISGDRTHSRRFGLRSPTCPPKSAAAWRAFSIQGVENMDFKLSSGSDVCLDRWLG